MHLDFSVSLILSRSAPCGKLKSIVRVALDLLSECKPAEKVLSTSKCGVYLLFLNLISNQNFSFILPVDMLTFKET